jgi:glutathionyl-hydroquinone reductase
MATRDVSSQSDITKMKTEADGTFKRAASAFRNTIEQGGKFEPARGMLLSLVPVYPALLTWK